MKNFAVFNPLAGTYVRLNTIEEVVAQSVDIAFELYMNQVHNTPFSVIEINDLGVETWRAPNGDEIKSPDQIKAEIEKRLKMTDAFANAGAIPVTTI